MEMVFLFLSLRLLKVSKYNTLLLYKQIVLSLLRSCLIKEMIEYLIINNFHLKTKGKSTPHGPQNKASVPRKQTITTKNIEVQVAMLI